MNNLAQHTAVINKFGVFTLLMDNSHKSPPEVVVEFSVALEAVQTHQLYLYQWCDKLFGAESVIWHSRWQAIITITLFDLRNPARWLHDKIHLLYDTLRDVQQRPNQPQVGIRVLEVLPDEPVEMVLSEETGSMQTGPTDTCWYCGKQTPVSESRQGLCCASCGTSWYLTFKMQNPGYQHGKVLERMLKQAHLAEKKVLEWIEDNYFRNPLLALSLLNTLETQVGRCKRVTSADFKPVWQLQKKCHTMLGNWAQVTMWENKIQRSLLG